MPHPKFLTFLIIIAICFGLSCTSNHTIDVEKNEFAKDFELIDSLYMIRELELTAEHLQRIRPKLEDDDIPNLTNYYYYSGLSSYDDINKQNRYADSALSLYTDVKTQERYTSGYLSAFMLKTEIFITTRQYEKAIAYFFEIKPLLNKNLNPIQYGNYLGRIALVYYKQQNYKMSAAYNAAAFNVLSTVKSKNPRHLFYLTQGVINNGGFSYEKANMLDSAEQLYRKGLTYVAKQATNGAIGDRQIKASQIVFLDNLGGLMAKKGNLEASEKILEKAIAIVDTALNGLKSTTYLKLSDTYAKLGKLPKADFALNSAKQLIFATKNDPYDLKLRYVKSLSDFQFLSKDYKSAAANLNRYLSMTDSINALKNPLSQVDLKSKFENLQGKKDLSRLENTNQNKTAYIVAGILLLIMLTPILILVINNVNQARKSRKLTIKHNLLLAEATQRLETRNKDYAKMMKVMAHDLKNPIGGMVGVVNLLLDDNRFAKEDNELLKLIGSSGENAIEMINQLLNSGLAVENEILIKENINLQHLLRQCCELLQYKADEKHQKVIFISGGPVKVMLSKEKIWRVFNNLIVNAIKFSPEGAEIKVVLTFSEKNVLVEIIDQGIGVPENDQDKIFEMFTVAKRAGTAGEQPFGIGLSVSKQIVDSHGGKIWLQQNPLGGTIFYVELPIS